jgi:phage terminase small subunit
VFLKAEHKVFSEEYVIDWNGTRAYRVAYPDCTEESAKASASRLLTDVNVLAYIEEIQKDIKKLAGVSALGNILMLKDIAEDDSAKHSDKIKAVEVINKMLPDFNATVKTDNTNKNTTTVIELGNGVKPVEDD